MTFKTANFIHSLFSISQKEIYQYRTFGKCGRWVLESYVMHSTAGDLSVFGQSSTEQRVQSCHYTYETVNMSEMA